MFYSIALADEPRTCGDTMIDTVTNEAPTYLLWPEDVQKRLVPIVCCWIAVAWMWLVFGTVVVTRSFVEVSADLFEGFGVGAFSILFSVAWAVVSFFAYQRLLWAIRVGFYLSFIGFSPFLVMLIPPLFQIAADGEFLLLGSFLTLMLSRFFVERDTGNSASRVGWFTYYICCASYVVLILALTWRLYFSEHSHAIRATIPPVFFMWLSVQTLVPYVSTCRVLCRSTQELEST